MELLVGTLVVVVDINRGAVVARLTGTGSETKDLIWDCFIMHLLVVLMHPPLL